MFTRTDDRQAYVVVKGGDGDDLLYGGAGDDIIEGGAGADRIYGGGGNDTLDPGIGGERIVDPVSGSVTINREQIYGEDGDDVLAINGGQDGRYMLADGGAGYDTVIVSTTTNQFFGYGLSAFERLVVQSALNVSYASNLTEILIADDMVNFAYSTNPLVDITLNNQFLSMAFSTFRCGSARVR